VALQGTLDTFALSDVLRLLAATKKTGRLRITGGRGTGSAWVESGAVSALEATQAPHATELVDALFELLRFEEGAFTFDAEAVHDTPGPLTDVETLLHQSEALLEEWREIELVVPSMDAWVTLRGVLPVEEISIDQGRWTTVVAVGGGATVRRVADELCLSELPVSRAIKDLVEVGLLTIEPTAPAGEAARAVLSRPVLTNDPFATEVVEEPSVAPTRARRAKAVVKESGEPELFVPLDLPGHAASVASYDAPDEKPMDDPSAAFPGLTEPSVATSRDDAEATDDDEETARQLATLSPRAASAVRAAAEAASDAERDAALDELDADGEPLNRGLLLKFLSSVKS